MDTSAQQPQETPSREHSDYRGGGGQSEEIVDMDSLPENQGTDRDNTDKNSAQNQVSAHDKSEEEPTHYPGGLSLALIIFSIWLALFLSALDRTIIATAIPRIADQFNSLADVGWYISSYMLTNCAFQLLFGRIYKFYSTKWVFIGCLGIFEIGSAVCGAAPTSIAFIIGRAIAGIGVAGIFSGSQMALLYTVPLSRRPIYMGLFGASFGIASVIAPLIGGVLTDKLSWRWCFYINLPIGGASFVVIWFFLKLPDVGKTKKDRLSIRQHILRLDPLGTVFFLPSIVCLILALQWGGTAYPWDSVRVIALLTIFSVSFIIFLGIQAWQKDNALIPLRIVMHRSIAAASIFTFTMVGSMTVILFYLTIWFQAIQGASALESGVKLIPLILSLAVASILSGFITSKIGYYVPAMIFTSVATSIASGFVTTFSPETTRASWIGFQVLCGLGTGAARQSGGLAVQATLPESDVAIGTAMIFFAQGLGGVVFVSIAQNIFINSLAAELAYFPNWNTEAVLDSGATDLQNTVAPQDINTLLMIYNHSLTRTFVLATVLSCISIVGALGIEWKSIKGMKRGPPGKRISAELEKKRPDECV